MNIWNWPKNSAWGWKWAISAERTSWPIGDEYERRREFVEENILPLNLKRTFHAPFKKIVPHSRDSGIRRRSRDMILRGMETAESLGCSTVVIHSAYDERDDGPDELERMTDDFVPFIEDLLNRFEPVISLENIHDRNTDFLMGIAGRIGNRRLGFCMDTGHMSAFGEISYAEWYETFRGRILHNHWHDNDGDRDAHGPLGSGSIDWKEIAGLRQAYAPGSTVALEIPSGEGIRRSLATLEKDAEISLRSHP